MALLFANGLDSRDNNRMSNLQSEYIQHPKEIGKEIRIQRCPKCHSIYLEDKLCESCGFQLDFDPLGGPLGERSFFFLQDEYYQSIPSLSQFFSFIPYNDRKRRKFKRNLIHRLKLIDDFMAEGPKPHDIELYQIEAAFVLMELKASFGVSDQELKEKYLVSSSHLSFFREKMHDLQMQKITTSKTNPIPNLTFIGLRVLRVLMGLIVFIFLSIWFFKHNLHD